MSRPRYLYAGTFPCGHVYIGQSIDPHQRWGEHKRRPSSWAMRDHYRDHPEGPRWEIVGNPSGYSRDDIDVAERRYIEAQKRAGKKLLNRWANDYAVATGRGPLPGMHSLTRPGRSSRGRDGRIYRTDWPRSETPAKCSICRRILPADSFGSDRFRTSGLRSRCRDCVRLYQRIMSVAETTEGTYARLKERIAEWDPAEPHPGALR